MKTILVCLVGVALGLAWAPSSEVEHGGGLNECGCHVNHKTGECHCHQDRGCQHC